MNLEPHTSILFLLFLLLLSYNNMEKIVRVVYKYTNPNSATVLLVGMNVCPVMGHTFMCPVFNSYDHG